MMSTKPEDKSSREKGVLSHRQRSKRRKKPISLLDYVKQAHADRFGDQVGDRSTADEELTHVFNKYGLSGIRLAVPGGLRAKIGRRSQLATIETTPGVCGGAARIAGTRIPVWMLVQARNLGATEAQILADYPSLRAVNLVDAWAYAKTHRAEIHLEIQLNEVA